LTKKKAPDSEIENILYRKVWQKVGRNHSTTPLVICENHFDDAKWY
jgi:hypothetical protein